ncbi:hypothetical protein [Lentzea aerocolonigenes]|uniref:hypothetical protein n=1 Tax=Lentzea aerocolonigenes TaxID=68170 RepID=UPI0004C3F910|nr:hypothetical protein [Lentzea aerocolonigenes]MCP2250131.1 hypothetical protein [Lentzea aerocolonigenes]
MGWDVDLGGWESVPPEELAMRPDLVSGLPAREAAARALKYARSAGQAPYDEIGFRSLAATPFDSYGPLQTFARARLDAERELRRRTPADLDLLLTQTRKLRHRPIAAPDGRMRFTVQDDLFNLTLVPENGEPDDGLVWSFPLSAPPKMFLDAADDRDEPQLFTQHARVDVPDSYWLPLPALIEAGRFQRMQKVTGDLVASTAPGNYYCFVSHRWLTPTAPDPDGRQARLIAWQLVAALCEAVYVAHERGLHTPRKVSRLTPVPVGASGSDLAEALIVNVLRPALDPAGLDALHAEIWPLQRETADRGVPASHADEDLSRLRALVAGHPGLRRLLDRVLLWYDYSCMPQPPRTRAEQLAFDEGLTHLAVHQIIGRTAILLDDADDYLTRAWCTLEALTADSAQNFDLLVGADRSTVVAGRTEHHLYTLLQDRPHVVWRALLDTEFFGVQTPDECLRRLELSATVPTDLPAVYAGLCRLGMPTKIHIDDTEVLTGVFPLPLVDGGRAVVLPASTARPADRPPAWSTATLDWTAVTRLGQRRGHRVPPSYVELERRWLGRGRDCHVVVIGSCEGEAALIAEWALARHDELASAANCAVGSLSWLATDVAPVGHFADGTLRTTTIDAPMWVLVAAGMRFERCATTAAILNALDGAGLPHVTVAVDAPENNVERHNPSQPGPDFSRRGGVTTAQWPGGLFRARLFDEIG